MLGRYEELRTQALDKEKVVSDLGLALFYRHGMLAWIKAWADCGALKARPQRKVIKGAAQVLPQVKDTMVMLLVNMVLGDGRGAQI